MNPFLKLLASNKAKGSFKIEAKADTDEATIYLYDMIVDSDEEAEWWGGVSPQSFIKALKDVTAPTIHLRVNSPGGSVFAARAIEQAIREHPSTVVAHVDGLAASAASFLIMAADKVVMAPGSFLMIHKAWTIAYGNADDFAKSADLLNQIDGSLAKTYARRTGQSAEDITTWMAAETWIEADNAVELGFADSVSEDTKPSNTAQPANWDFSAFKNAPQTGAKPGTKPGQNGTKPPENATNPSDSEQAAKEAAQQAAHKATATAMAEIEHEERRRAVLKALIPA